MEQEDEAVAVLRDGHIAVVSISRPPHNFLTEPILAQLASAIEQLDGVCRAVVVAAEGKSFCAGANFRSSVAPDPSAGGSFAGSADRFYAQAIRIFSVGVPLIAAVHGPAIGAGFGLALACDLRVMGETAWLQANFVRLGIHPGFALSATLPRLVGPGRAADLFLTGRKVGAEEALRIGLVDRVAPSQAVLTVAVELAGEIASGAPLAVASTRATLRSGLSELAADALSHELAEQSRLAGTADAVEGVAAMLDRRMPSFEGR